VRIAINPDHPAVLRSSRRTCLGVCLNLKPSVTQVAFAPEGVNGRGVIRSDFLLLRIITHAHADVIVACSTAPGRLRCVRCALVPWMTHHHMLKGSSNRVIRIPWSSLRARSPSACLPSERVSQSRPDLSSTRTHTSVGVETSVLLPIVIWWIVFIEA